MRVTVGIVWPARRNDVYLEDGTIVTMGVMQHIERRRAGILFPWVLLVFALVWPAGALAANWTADDGVVTYAVDASDDGSLVVAGKRDNAVVGYDATGAELWRFETGGTVYGVSVSRDGERIAVASEDRHVYLLDRTGQEIWNAKGTQTFQSVSISGDGQIIVAGAQDRTVTQFDASGNQIWQTTLTDQVTSVAVYGGGQGFRVVTGTRDSRVALLGGDGQRIWETLLDYTVRGLDVTGNGAAVVAGDDRGTVYQINGASGDITWTTAIGTASTAVAMTNDGATIVAGTGDGVFAVLGTDGTVAQRDETGAVIHDVALSADATLVAAGTDTGAAVYERDESGSFSLPKPESRWERFLLPAAIVIGVILLVLAVLGFRKRPDGERAWRGATRTGRSTLREVWDARISYIFLIPTIVLLLVFNYYPAFSGIYHAFTDWTPGGDTHWVGFDNFRDMRENRYLWAGVGNLVILIVTGFLKLLIPLLIAEMIFHLRSGKLAYTYRTLFVLQVIVPGVVGVLLWVNVYDPNIGILNQFLEAIGLESWTRSWLGDADTAMWSIVFMGFPWVSAFALLIFYGGLISIPGELFDSAALDGASVFRRILNIDLPLLLGQIRLLLILTFIATVQEFAAIFLTTGGGPGSATYVPSLELYYQAVRFNNFGMASAIGAVLFMVILAGTIINLRYVKSSVEYSA